MEHVIHTLEPIYDAHSKILILGSMPSPKSRETGFYYGHPQNRFWRVMQMLFQTEALDTKEKKTAFLLQHHIALWDVLQSCEIEGADDNSIQQPIPNDLEQIYRVANIQRVFTTGKTATKLFHRLMGQNSIYLPSTSPANCRLSLDELVEEYRILLQYS